MLLRLWQLALHAFAGLQRQFESAVTLGNIFTFQLADSRDQCQECAVLEVIEYAGYKVQCQIALKLRVRNALGLNVAFSERTLLQKQKHIVGQVAYKVSACVVTSIQG